MQPVSVFGRLADGREVHAIRLGGAGLRAQVLTYGAILRELSVEIAGRRRNLVLALDELRQYELDAAFVGPVVGRFGNRIAGGRFAIDGVAHQLSRNENGNHLHGGFRGTGRQLWRVSGTPSESQVTLSLDSPAGDEGYPGNLHIDMHLQLLPDALRVEFTAHTDAPTPLNLTWHPYFNLGGDAGTHWLRIPASRYLPVGQGLIPTGEIAPVAGTPFDFRSGRSVTPPPVTTHPQLALGGGYDHCWVLDADADCQCELRPDSEDVTLRMSGSGPGLQFYSGQFLARTHPQLGSGIALEPQGFPDAPNHGAFPDSILRPEKPYRALIEYAVRPR